MDAVMSPGGFMVTSFPRTVVRDRTEGRSRADLAMERYADGDDSACADLYEQLMPRIHAIGFRWTRSESASRDLVQETFLKLIEARGTFRPGARVLPWACAIARNLLTDGHRQTAFEVWASAAQLREADEAAASDDRPADEALDLRRREAALREELARLPPGHREAFELTHLAGLSVKEAARRLDVTSGMIKIRTFRAVAALRAADARRTGDR
jgi:RNA polymerase sigma-70 factor (ECF subfamily)